MCLLTIFSLFLLTFRLMNTIQAKKEEKKEGKSAAGPKGAGGLVMKEDAGSGGISWRVIRGQC